MIICLTIVIPLIRQTIVLDHSLILNYFFINCQVKIIRKTVFVELQVLTGTLAIMLLAAGGLQKCGDLVADAVCVAAEIIMDQTKSGGK